MVKIASLIAVALLTFAPRASAGDAYYYTYDAQGRLTQVIRDTASVRVITVYTFDDADNRTVRTVSVTPLPMSAPLAPNGEALTPPPLVPGATTTSTEGVTATNPQGASQPSP